MPPAASTHVQHSPRPVTLRPGLGRGRKVEADEGAVDNAGPISLGAIWQVMSVWDFEAAVERRDATGGTSKRSVLEQAAKLEAWAEPKAGNGGMGAPSAKKQKK